jgi:hypothetical protein
MQVLASYEHDDYTRDVLAKLAIDGVAMQHFSMHQGLLRYKSRIWVGCDVQLQQKLISACHASALGGHSGFSVTFLRLKNLFAWKSMKVCVANIVKSCMVYQ